VPEPIRIALLGYHGVQTLDLVGPLDAFHSATQARPGAYRTLVVTLDGSPFRSEAGLKVVPECALADAGPIDTLMVPGGEGVRRPGIGDALAAALRQQATAPRRVVSVCTGIYAVAAAGLLDERTATTHWRYAADVAARFPAVRIEADAIFIKDGRVYSSAGITAAIDLSLALIEEDFGPALALTVARDLVVYLKRAGGQQQYSEPLRFQARVTDRFAELAAWMMAHLHEKLSIETLAARACLSPRQFSREFRRVFGRTPAEQLETLRLDAAREHLITSGATVDRIASAVGFRSSDAFRRAFDRRFGLSPSDYRHRFAANAALEKGHCDANLSPTVVALPAAAERGGR
jgi:transcriptional regulator GlxA family with amidase domain